MKKRIGRISITFLLILISALLVCNLTMRPVKATKIDDAAVISAVAVIDALVDTLILLQADGMGSTGISGGDVYYVDSGATAGTGTGADWANAELTIDAAVGNCSASNGDVIFVAPGHAESFTSEGLDVDVVGVTIIGLGSGATRPTITYAHANGEVAIGAASVSIKNIRFFSSTPDVLMGIEVESGVDYFTIEDCEFVVDTDGTDEFAEAINFVSANENCTVKNCIFNAKAGNSVAAIMLDNTADCLDIIGNDIRGDYSSACIFSDGACTDVLIRNNLLINGALVADTGSNTEPAIEVANNTAGMVMDNTIVSDVATVLLMRVADDMTFSNNWCIDKDGDEFSATLETLEAASVDAAVDGG